MNNNIKAHQVVQNAVLVDFTVNGMSYNHLRVIGSVVVKKRTSEKQKKAKKANHQTHQVKGGTQHVYQG